MKYKIGDKVRVRMDLDSSGYTEYRMEYDHAITNNFVSSMKRWEGKEVTIANANNISIEYYIEEDYWGWTDEMFEGFNENNEEEEYLKGKF